MERKCDGCTLCCTLTKVPELKKPINLPCVHCNQGCMIYKDRPQSCRDFKCAWLQGDMPEWMRPDKVHIMIEKLPNVPVVIALPEISYENAWRTNEVVEILKQEYQSKGIAVVASDQMALIPEGQTIEKVMNNVITAARLMGVM